MDMNTPVIVGHIESRRIRQLKESSNNARSHSAAQIQQIAASIREFGFVNPILVGTDDTVVAGHARLRAARQLGMEQVPVIVLAHLSDAQRRALVLADNQLALNAGWDEDLLRAELAALEAQQFDLKLIGFHEAELARLLADQDADRPTDPDALPAVSEVSVTVPGDVWILGNHRLLCGDATNIQAMETVLASGNADMVFTDPSYNLAYQGETPDKLAIDDEALGDQLYEFLRAACANIVAVCRGAIYICMPSLEWNTLYRAFCEAGGHWSTFLIWSKDGFTLGRSDYQRQYEPILYGWAKGKKHYWCGDRNQGDVWSIVRPFANREHPTAKPVELVERAVENSSRRGETVLDPFAGSGTTLIACERHKRRARLIEIDPRYADLICRRWEEFSGQAAVLEGDGRTFEDIAQQRLSKAA
jgi:DNA modification methylase